MFGFGRKSRWTDPGAPKQFGDGENIWTEGPTKGKFIDPEETGPTVYDELVTAAESSPESPRFKPEPQAENDAYDIQDRLIQKEDKEWAQVKHHNFMVGEDRQGRRSNERHNPHKGGERITDHLADNDNAEDTSKREEDIIRSIDEMAA